MPTTKPQKSVNLDLADHELAQKIAQFMDRKNQENYESGRYPLQPSPVTIKATIHAGLTGLARHLGMIE